MKVYILLVETWDHEGTRSYVQGTYATEHAAEIAREHCIITQLGVSPEEYDQNPYTFSTEYTIIENEVQLHHQLDD